MSWKIKALKKSPWVFHVNAGACNNCDIEIVNCLTPKFDVERFGIKLVGSPRHADALLVTGVGTRQAAIRVREIYRQTSTGIFSQGYHVVGPVDKIIREVDPNAIIMYVPGCPPKPEAIISGVVKALAAI
jgi:Ni,Fe-hydrogenase III small subunit